MDTVDELRQQIKKLKGAQQQDNQSWYTQGEFDVG